MLLMFDAPDAGPRRHGPGRTSLIFDVIIGQKPTPGLISGVTGSIRKLGIQRGLVSTGPVRKRHGAAPRFF